MMNLGNVFDSFDYDLANQIDFSDDVDAEFIGTDRKSEQAIMREIEIYFEEEDLQSNIAEVF